MKAEEICENVAKSIEGFVTNINDRAQRGQTVRLAEIANFLDAQYAELKKSALIVDETDKEMPNAAK